MFRFFPVPEFWRALLSSLVALLTLVGVMTRPFRWNEARIAMGGAGVLLLLGLISPADALFTLVRDLGVKRDSDQRQDNRPNDGRHDPGGCRSALL